ncbi:alpha/beta-hydrolase [Punctularia strigosozonata HHB-11173 SS5]|uniref:alpha/beta-hydrolase n=1 Tax=Punctularia strigosozonata (strain HHB-11173) TaxID=741275 RepID=UPI000441704F|nr:alpha/beta-hydrolase [Punctularia strigosozonata HHB-11173 SS5]EIN09953.1 alpha/beta-hydrolase [Punctularia strigosozonata HHB-11173 SS5]
MGFIGASSAAILAAALLASPVSAFTPQQAFFAPPSFASDPALALAEAYSGSTSAGRFPNLNTRFEVTSRNDSLFCGKEGDKYKSGYAHFTNVDGKEDKHLFWWLYEARNDPANAPVVLVFGGGPGTTGMMSPLLGEGPCLVTGGEDNSLEKPHLVAAPYSWTDYVNLIAIDHPVGVGFSHGAKDSLRRTSEEAAWDIDDFLQAFWAEYPELAKNQFMVHSGSYGGTYIPNLVNVMRNRNLAAKSDAESLRLIKIPEQIMMSNVWSDPATHYRHWVSSACYDLGFYNRTGCEAVIRDIPACLDSIQLANEQPTIKNKYESWSICSAAVHQEFLAGKDPSDNRCDHENCFMNSLLRLTDILNGTDVKAALGVPQDYNYNITAGFDRIGLPFILAGDLQQPAYKLLGPAIEDGLRVLVYNGNNDGICPRRGNLAWMNLLQTKYQDEFRAAPEVGWPGVGWFKQAAAGNGTSAGNYTFVSVYNSGHAPFLSQPKATRDILIKWLKNEPFLSK